MDLWFVPLLARARSIFAWALIPILLFTSTLLPALSQTREVPGSAIKSSGSGILPSGRAANTDSTIPNIYEDAVGNLYKVDAASRINQENINKGVAKILTGEYSPLVFQAAEQNEGVEIQKAANNILNASLGGVNETYHGMHQWFKDDVVGNLFQNIGQLVGKWMSEIIDGWMADTVQFLAKVLRIFVLNPNIAVNGLDGKADDGISKYVRQAADVMYGIAVDLLLLLFILCIWKFWAEASWNGAGNLMGPVGRLIATSGLMLAWPTIYAFIIQISNEMIKAIYFNSPQDVAMLEYTLAQAVKGGLVAVGAGATMVLAPVAANLALPVAGSYVGSLFYFASSLVFTILGGILIAEIVYVIVLKAIQTALLTAQYMFAPIFLVFFALPDTEEYATTYVRAFVETSLWTFVWVGLLKVLTIVVFSNFNPWGKILVSIGVLQLMIQVPTFLAKAKISPASDFLTPGLVLGASMDALKGLKDAGMKAVGDGVGWYTDGRFADTGLAKTKNVGMKGLPGEAGNKELLNSLNSVASKDKDSGALKNMVQNGPSLKQNGEAKKPDDKTKLAAAGLDPANGQKINMGTAEEKADGVALNIPPEKEAVPLTPSPGMKNVGAQPIATPPMPQQGPAKKVQANQANANSAKQAATANANQTSMYNVPTVDAGGWDMANLSHVDTRKLLSDITSCNGVGLRVGQSKTSVIGSADGGVSRVNFAAGANESELAHGLYAAGYANRIKSDDAAKDAARTAAAGSQLRQPQGLMENMAANWLSNTGSSWNKTALAKQRFQHAMFEAAVQGSQAYVSRQKGNAYTDYLRDNFGDWTDEKDAMAVHLISNPQSTESPWNRNIGPATEALVGSGLPIGADTRGAAQNPAIQSMHPSRRKQAIVATLAYTYQSARQSHGHEHDSVFSLAHGELAKSLSAEEVEQVLVMNQISGPSDLNSPMATQYMQCSSELALNTNADFATAYQCITSAAPFAAHRLGHVPVHFQPRDIGSLSSLHSIISSVHGPERTQEIMTEVLESTTDMLGALHQQRIPMNVVQQNSAPMFQFFNQNFSYGNNHFSRS